MMTENRTQLAQFLRSLPKGTNLYSPLCDYVKFVDVNESGIMVSLPTSHAPELPDTLLFRDNGHMANHEQDNDEKYQIFPSHVCRSWRFLRFKKGDVIVMEFNYKDGSSAKYTVLYEGFDVSHEWHIHARYIVCGDSDEWSFSKEVSFQPLLWKENELLFRYANRDEAIHFLAVLKTRGADVKAQALVAAHLQDINFLEHLNNETSNNPDGSL